MKRLSIFGVALIGLLITGLSVPGQQDPRGSSKQPSGASKGTAPAGNKQPGTSTAPRPKPGTPTTPKDNKPKPGTPTTPKDNKGKPGTPATPPETKPKDGAAKTSKDGKAAAGTAGKDAKDKGAAGKNGKVPPVGPQSTRAKDKTPTQPTHTKTLYSRIPGANLNDGEKKAFDGLAAGRPLTQGERGTLRDLLASNRPGLTPDLREGISVMLNAEEPQPNRNPTPQGQRYLRVKNDTPEPLTVRVQYRSVNPVGAWIWAPGDPEQSREALTYTLEPGEITYLNHGEKLLSASRVRIWAESPSDEWPEYRDQDLRLVTEMDARRTQFVYYADRKQTYLFTFRTASE